jgi:class 3 adenylate cyclase
MSVDVRRLFWPEECTATHATMNQSLASTCSPVSVGAGDPALFAPGRGLAEDRAPSHQDLIAPISQILDYANLLEQELRGDVDERRLETVAKMRRAAQMLLTMVEGAEEAAPPSGIRPRCFGANDNVGAGPSEGSERTLAAELQIRNLFIQKTFGRYLSDGIVQKLLDTPEGLRLGGETRHVTILMSDLRDFTSLTEGMEPERVMRLLNNYLGAMTEIIAGFGGTIVEFIGDAVFALFGLPSPDDDDAERAVACALTMQLAMRGVNAAAAAAGLPPLEMGIALNTGDVIVGNIGGETRTKYGAVGSHVNLAGRLQAHAAGGEIVISESTRAAAGAGVELGTSLAIRVKGFTVPVLVHDVRGLGAPYDLRLSELQGSAA